MAQLAAFPDVMSLHQSGYVVMMTLVGGGLVSFWGPVIGVFVFLIARDVIGALTNAWMLYFGLLFIAIVLFRPEGIAGAISAAVQRHSLNALRQRGTSGDATAVRGRAMSMIEAAGVHVRFGDRVVLESVDLAVAEGEFHGVMGPNGAGKTTFFNVLTGRVKPSRGSSPARRRGRHRPQPAPDRRQGRRPLVPDHDPVRRVLRAATTS